MHSSTSQAELESADTYFQLLLHNRLQEEIFKKVKNNAFTIIKYTDLF